VTLRLPSTTDRVRLIGVALGRAPADLVVTGGHVLNGPTGELLRGDIAVAGKWIAAVGEVDRCIGPGTEIIEAHGRPVTAGLIDAHFHIEGSMVTVTELARALLPRGVTTLMCDPHEIGNVLGVRGMVALIDEAADLPLKVFLRVPPQIPGTPGLETTGAILDDDSFCELLRHPSVISAAGDCSPTWLLDPDESHLDRLGHALAQRFTINGQEPGLDLQALDAFVAAGPQDTHIATNCDMLLGELRRGLRAIVNDMPGQFPDEELRKLGRLLRDGAIDCRNVMFCADDVHPNRLLANGGVDAAVRRAVRCGVPWPMAVRMATINAATHYNVDHLYGSVLPGHVADIVILEDPELFVPAAVIADGKAVSGIDQWPVTIYPDWARDTIKLERPVVVEDFALPVPDGCEDGDWVHVRTIFPGLATEGRLLPGTEKQEGSLPGRVAEGTVQVQGPADFAVAAIIDRHTASSRIGRAVVEGFGLRGGALASTVNHDNHNLLVIGTNAHDMAVAANAVAAAGGGLALGKGGKVLDLLALPIAGLISDRPIEEVARAMDRLEHTLVTKLGVSDLIPQPIMLIQMFALANIPKLGLTDHGLIDVLARQAVPAVAALDGRAVP
jgi:adenine deaminase